MSISIPPISCVRRVIPGSVRTDDFDSELVSVDRVTNITSGGAVFSLSAFYVVGNYKNFFGFGQGKAGEAAIAKNKALNKAKKNLYFIALREGRTISHSVEGKCGAVKIKLRPARKGTGIIAPTSVKILFELIGIKDIVAKSYGPSNVRATILAAVHALTLIKSAKLVAQTRKVKVADILRGDEDSF